MTHAGEQSLLIRTYSMVNPPFMFLADRTNLETIRSADFLMFDGTFAYCPREFYNIDYEINGETKTTSGQTYTMHAVFSDLPERQTNLLCGKNLSYYFLFVVNFRNCIFTTQITSNVCKIVY